MSFGSRRFAALVAKDSVVDGQLVREYFARFLPLDLSSEGEQVDEVTLRRQVDDNAREAFPLPCGEEKLALAAFTAQHGGKATHRARIAAQAERAATRQTSILDPLQPAERATVERFRKASGRHTEAGLTRSVNSLEAQHYWADLNRDVLAILDGYLPKPKGT